MHNHRRLGGILIALFVPFAVWAGALVLPFTFQPGTPIRASEMNDNFAAIKQAVDDLDARVSQVGGGLVRSGTRLKTLTVEGPDGLSSPVVTYNGVPVYFDSRLQTVCFTNVQDDATRGFCLPFSPVKLSYVDASCQVPVIAKYGENTFLPFAGDAGMREFVRVWGLPGDALEFREAGAFSADAGLVYDSFQTTTGLPDGGSTTTTSCRLDSQLYRTAPIVRTIGVNDLAPVTYQFR